MIALLQRVSSAFVDVAGQRIAEIPTGLLVLVGVEATDGESNAERLAERVRTYRMFGDADGKMNLSVQDVGGSLLLVPQFTLAADTKSGTRPSFTPAAEPNRAQFLFNHFVARMQLSGVSVSCGRFGADMKVGLVNDGPVTFWLRS